MNARTNQRNIQTIFRKNLILPTEHGSWSWLLVPFFVGAGIGGRFNLPVFLTLIAGLSVFFLRQPATVWFRVKRGRARQADGALAAIWIGIFSSLAAVSLVGLLLLGKAVLLWLLGPLTIIFVSYLIAARYGRVGLRSLWMELSGAGALAMTAPAAMVVITGGFTGLEWVVWGIMATQNILGALYVRLRIYDTHNQFINRSMILLSHIIGLMAIYSLVALDLTSFMIVVPFVVFLIRAIWAVSDTHPVRNIKRFGFTEMGIEIVSGAWIVLSY